MAFASHDCARSAPGCPHKTERQCQRVRHLLSVQVSVIHTTTVRRMSVHHCQGSWVKYFVDRSQEVLCQANAMSAGAWLAMVNALLDIDPPQLAVIDRIVTHYVLSRIVLTLRSLDLIPAARVGPMMRVLHMDDMSSVFEHLRHEINIVRVSATAAEYNVDDHRVTEALRVIQQRHADVTMSLVFVSTHVNLSPWYLARLLRSQTGRTFEWFLHQTRVQHAQRLLHNPTVSIKEIAYSVGYSSTSQLDRHFRRMCGVTPKAYRQRL